ncbi:MAG TPA: hypothetical protein PLZ36_13220 [Armatimonadota bacterium]|nr:hypothetical protein [Armatimonadota bacterium]
MTNGITLESGPFGWDYLIQHDDGRELLIQSDWDFPGLAMTFGWTPCRRCRRSCKGATDGTIACPRRSAFEHILDAQAWLDTHIGKRVTDPGYFTELED